MAPRMKNLIPDMKETRYSTTSFANPYAPVVPKQTAFKTPPMTMGLNPSPNPSPKPFNFATAKQDIGVYENGPLGRDLVRNGQIVKRNGEAYRPKNDKDSWFIFTDTRPSWMVNQDVVNKNIATYGSPTPSFGQLVHEIIGVGYDRSGKFGVDPVNLATGIALGGAGKAFRASLGAVSKYQGAKLATKLAALDAEVIANRTVIRAAGRAAADVRQTARRARRSTTVRAARMQRVEESLKGSNEALAQRFGDRAWSATRGTEIAREMAQSDTVGIGKRFRPGPTRSVGFGASERLVTERIPTGARSFPNFDSPLAGSHHSYTPLSKAWPSGEVSYPFQGLTRGSNDAFEWLARTAGASDSYGRTGVERLSAMYSGGVPKGGWMRRPNLRKNNPLPARWTGDDLRTPVINPGEMADGINRDRVAALLDDATSFRNRAAWRLPDGRTAFPKAFDWILDPKWQPEAYQNRVFRAAQEAASRTRALPAPKKKIGGGK